MENKTAPQPNQKLVKTARGFYIAAKIAYILSAVGCLACIVLAIVLPLTLKLTNNERGELISVMVGLAVYCFFMIGALWNIEQMFREIHDKQTVYDSRVFHYMKKSGIGIILLSVVSAFIQTTLIMILAPDSEIDAAPIQLSGLIAGLVLYIVAVFLAKGKPENPPAAPQKRLPQ